MSVCTLSPISAVRERAIWVLAPLLILSSPKPGRAEETAPIHVGFEYTAEPRCMTEDQAFSLVHRRSRRAIRTEAAEATQILKMDVSSAGTGYRGVLTVRRENGPAETRAMAGQSCDEVVEALALTAALSIDPHATLTLGPVEPREPPSDKLPAEVARSEQDPALDETRDVTTEFSLGASFAFEKTMVDSVHGSGSVVFGISQPDDRVVFPLEARVSLLGSTSLAGAPTEGIETQRLATKVAYCPFRFGQALSLSLCPVGEFGLLFARGRGFESETNATRLLAQAGGEAWLRARVGRRAQLWLSPALMVPLTKREFAVDPGPEVLTSTVDVGWRVSSGIGWVF